MLLYRSRKWNRFDRCYQIKLMYEDHLQFESYSADHALYSVAAVLPTKELNKNTSWDDDMLCELCESNEWADGITHNITEMIYCEDSHWWSDEIQFSSLAYDSAPGIRKDEFVIVTHRRTEYLVQCRRKRDLRLQSAYLLPWQGKYWTDARLRINFFSDLYNDVTHGRLNTYIAINEGAVADFAANAPTDHEDKHGYLYLSNNCRLHLPDKGNPCV